MRTLGLLPALLTVAIGIGCASTNANPTVSGTPASGVASTAESSTAPAPTPATAGATTSSPTSDATTTTPVRQRPPLPIELADSTFATTFRPFGLIRPLPDGTDDAIGSGCTVEGPLPDGVWFGHILEYTIPPGTTEVTFDLACVDDYDHEFRSWTMTNAVADVREVPIGADTRFVLSRPSSIRTDLDDGGVSLITQTPWTIVRPEDESEELTDETFRHHDWLWGWALVENAILVEFFDTDRWQIQNNTHTGHEAVIAAGLLRQGPDHLPPPRAADGFDGSGCSPDTTPLPNGRWFGHITYDSPRDIRFDLLCMTSDPEMWDRLGLDPLSIEDRTSVDDDDPTEYQLTIAADAGLYLISIDTSQTWTPLTVDDPRFQHFAARPETPYRRAVWVSVVDGVVTEIFTPFEA